MARRDETGGEAMEARQGWIVVLTVALLLAGLAAGASPARADSHSGGQAMESYPVGGPYPELVMPDDPWRYETGYFFALTRGLADEPLSDLQRGFAMVGTIPLDVATLVGAALAGLFG